MTHLARHVLYIDDVPDHLLLMQKVIETRLPGVVVDTCESISGAEEKLSQRCYDLIITDINLRGELGTRVAEQILQTDPEQPVLLVSAYVGEPVKKQIDKLKEQYGVPCWPKQSLDMDGAVALIGELVNQRPCARLSTTDGHPNFCRFKICMREDHGGSRKEVVLTRPHLVPA